MILIYFVRYEVNESRMSDDCSQYLQQLQKDWERQRVRMGVEALRKEVRVEPFCLCSEKSRILRLFLD